MSIEVDLATHVLTEEHGVFFARPGARYHLYADVIAESTILVDLPNLDLDKGLSVEAQPDLGARIRRARTLRRWHNARREPTEPSRDLADYALGTEKGLPQLRSTIKGFFEVARKGDLVLVAPGPYSLDAYIGELVDDAPGYVEIAVPRRYEADVLTGRRVRWLARFPKRLLTGAILDIIDKPNAFVRLPKSVRPGIYDRAYASYALPHQYSARFDVAAETFRSFDDLILQAFFNFVAYNTRAVSEGRESEVGGLGPTAFSDAGEYAAELRTNVNSPGFLTLTSTHVAPLVTAALLALAITVGPDAAKAAQEGTLRIGNSKAPAGDPCTAEVARQALRQLQLLGLDEWPAACEKARDAASGTQLKVPASVKP